MPEPYASQEQTDSKVLPVLPWHYCSSPEAHAPVLVQYCLPVPQECSLIPLSLLPVQRQAAYERVWKAPAYECLSIL